MCARALGFTKEEGERLGNRRSSAGSVCCVAKAPLRATQSISSQFPQLVPREDDRGTSDRTEGGVELIGGEAAVDEGHGQRGLARMAAPHHRDAKPGHGARCVHADATRKTENMCTLRPFRGKLHSAGSHALPDPVVLLGTGQLARATYKLFGLDPHCLSAQLWLTSRRGMVVPAAALLNLTNRSRHPLDAIA